MTIDEAIQHKQRQAKAMWLNCKNKYEFGMVEEERQIIEWLGELKSYRNQHQAICDKYNISTIEELYTKAIDDVINEIVSTRSEVAEKEPYDEHLFTVLVNRQNEIIELIQKLKGRWSIIG